MMNEWRNGGYFLMGPVAEGALKDSRLPRLTWSISTCVSDSYPDETYLEWVQSGADHSEALCEALRLGSQALAELRADVTDLFNRGVIRWPNVFGTSSSARDFHGRWFAGVPNVRLFGISLRGIDVDEYLGAVGPVSNPSDGVSSLLSENHPPDDGETWGFEVLGSDYGSFHTYLCHGLQTELMDSLDVRFNDHGLIGNWSDAKAASDWINRDEVGAEPVPWFPWRVDAYPLV